MFGTFGFTELILILFIVLIIFGAGKLPQLGEGLGKAIKGFKKSVHEAEAMDIETQTQNEAGEAGNSGSPAQIPQTSQSQAISSPPRPNEPTGQVTQPQAVSTKA